MRVHSRVKYALRPNSDFKQYFLFNHWSWDRNTPKDGDNKEEQQKEGE